MAHITINSVDAYVPTEKRNNITSNSVLINYSALASWANIGTSDTEPNTGTGGSGQEITWYTFLYSSLRYSWDLGGVSSNIANGNATINNLTSGQKNNITCTITISGEETIIEHRRTDWYHEGYDQSLNPGPEPELDGTDSTSIEEHAQWQERNDAYQASYYSYWTTGETTSSESTTTETATRTIIISVYTHPGNFTDYNFAVNTTIESPAGLTAGKVDNWIAHCNAFNNWYNQPSIASNESNIGATCAVTTGDYITAQWYNNCVAAIADPSVRPSIVTGGPNGTIITTSVIGALGTAISIEDPS